MCAKRKNAAAKRLTFSNDFYSDLEADGMLHALLIRSPVAGAMLVSVSHPMLPQGYHLFSAADIAGKKNIAMLGVEMPVFCTGEIRYKGEPIGVLVGADEKKLRELIGGVEIRYEERMSVPQGLLAERVVQTDPQLDDLFAEAATTVEESWSCAMYPQSCREPNGAFAFFRAGVLHVSTPTQWISHLRTTIAAVTGVEKENIAITRTQISGLDTNTIWINAQLAAQTAVCALLTKKPVKLVLSRAEQQTFIENAAPVTITHKTALNADGEIIAADVAITMDGGAYNPFARECLDRLCIASCNVYQPKAARIHGQVFCTAQPPRSVDLATIDSNAFYAIENHLQKIAEMTGISPLELRKKNYPRAVRQPLSLPFQFGCEHVTETLEAVCRVSDFNRKYVAYYLNEASRYGQDNNSPFAPPLRGVGLTCGFSGCGFNGTSLIKASPSLEVTLETDGSLHIHAFPTSHSVREIWKTIAADTLGIDKKRIVLNSDFEPDKEPESPDTLHSNISIMTHLLRGACETIRRKKDSATLPLTVRKTVAPSKKKLWDKERFSGMPYQTNAFAACVVEVELDPSTYREHIRGIWMVVDGGKILHARAAESTIKSSIQQILRELMENDTMRCAHIRVQFVQSDSDPKQISDLASAVLPAAMTAALSQALAITLTRLPLQSDTLYRLTKKAQRCFAEKTAAEAQEKAAARPGESAANPADKDTGQTPATNAAPPESETRGNQGDDA